MKEEVVYFSFILALAFCFTFTNAFWMPPSHRPKNEACIPSIKRQFRKESYYNLQSSTINLKFLEKTSEEDDQVSSVASSLSQQEDDALRSAAKMLSETYGVGFFEKPEAWEQAKVDFPILNNYENNDLRDAYLKQRPKILELFTETPLGPFVAINLLFKLTGFTWCDTPFHQDGACPPL